MTEPTDTSAPDGAAVEPLDELAEIGAELAALLSWETLTGGFGLPRPPQGALEAAFGPPVDLSRAPPAPSAPASGSPLRAPSPSPQPSGPRLVLEPPSARPAVEARPTSEPRPSSEPRPAAEPPRGAQLGLPTRWAALAAVPSNDPAGALAAVRAEIGDCKRCPLCEGRKKIVFGVGSPTARLVVVGEAPGAREDELGEPFVGDAGEMLDKMLENVLGLTRAQVYILNVVKCRPPGNRNPELVEIAACRRFMEAQIEAIKPQLMLSVGNIATKTLLNTTRGITSMRGQWHMYQGRIPLMATFHPAYLLRTPADKRLTLEDLKLVRQRLNELGAGG